MPDTLSVALGGGSIVNENGTVGPTSLGHRLFSEGVSFGGSTATLCDAAVTLGNAAIPGAKKCLDAMIARNVLAAATETLEKLTMQMVAKDDGLPWLLVGGGASLFASEKFTIPPHAHVANAFGAAFAEVSAEIDRVVSLENREKTLSVLKEEVLQQVVNQRWFAFTFAHRRHANLPVFLCQRKQSTCGSRCLHANMTSGFHEGNVNRRAAENAEVTREQP